MEGIQDVLACMSSSISILARYPLVPMVAIHGRFNEKHDTASCFTTRDQVVKLMLWSWGCVGITPIRHRIVQSMYRCLSHGAGRLFSFLF